MWDGNRYGFKSKVGGVGKPTIRIHPTQKPVALYRWLLQNYAKPNDKILDTHVGSASSLIACEMEGFDYVGFELDADYYRDSMKRLEQSRQQMRLL
jgi:site-specific DNA-methyltransferase (adenine-specific)